MYLISAYFDEKTNRTIERWIEGVARASGNHFMPEHNVPPHLTVSAFDARDPEPVLRCDTGKANLISWNGYCLLTGHMKLM